MIRFVTFIVLVIAGLSGRTAAAQVASELTLPPAGDNQRAEVTQWIGLVRVSISYHSPRVHLGGVQDRTGHIWGEVVKYGLFDDGFGPATAAPWRAGANESTTISFSHDVTVGGKPLKAGTYALYMKLDQAGPWTLILSTSSIGWGSYQYDPANNALEVPVTPEEAPFTEYLTYGFTDRVPNSAVAFLQWENKRIPFKIDVPNVNELYITQIRTDLQAWPGFKYQNWQQAAQFAVLKKINLDEALVWANRAIYEPFRNAATGREDFSTFSTKASVLQALGRQAEADSTMDLALRGDGASAPAIHQYGMRLLATGRNDRAMAIFKTNRERHPDDTFWPYVGLARGYAALGDRKKAIANWEIALQHVPPAQEPNRSVFEQALQKLKQAGPA